jgi:hypothetical protein
MADDTADAQQLTLEQMAAQAWVPQVMAVPGWPVLACSARPLCLVITSSKGGANSKVQTPLLFLTASGPHLHTLHLTCPHSMQSTTCPKECGVGSTGCRLYIDTMLHANPWSQSRCTYRTMPAPCRHSPRRRKRKQRAGAAAGFRRCSRTTPKTVSHLPGRAGAMI